MSRPRPSTALGTPPGGAARLRIGAWALAVVALVAAAVGSSGPLLAQEAPGPFELLQLERRYEAAAASCEAAVLARQADQPDYDRALQQVMAADRLGDDAALEAAQSAFLETSQIIDGRQRRVVEQCGLADDARRTYLSGLDGRRRVLESELAEPVSPRREAEIQALLTDIDNRYQELEAEAGGREVQLVMRPLIQIAGTDTPESVAQKAAYLRRLVGMAESLISDLEADIERLESRMRRQQSRENFESNVGRFDQLRTPVGSGGGEEDARTPAAADSTDVGSRPMESRLAALRDAKLQVEHYRDQMRARVREFEEYLERIT